MDRQELDLWERYRKGDRTALDELILFYFPLVKLCARRISLQAPWAISEDLAQEGVFGLIKAIKNFDPEKGDNFKSYARPYVRGAMFDSSELTRNLKRSVDERSRRIRAAHDQLMQELQRKPTSEEVSARCGLSVEDIDNVTLVKDVAFAKDDLETGEYKEKIDDSMISQERMLMIEEALLSLPERDRLIVIDHNWFGLSLAATAMKYALKEENAKKIHQRAIIKLRALLGPKSGSQES